MITQEELKELLSYSHKTGIFAWKKSRSGVHKHASLMAGGHIPTGYIRIKINGRAYQAHRLAWLYHFGHHPANEVDHINHVRDDNRIINLRECTSQENSRNLTIRSDNKSGITGVNWHKKNCRWRPQITVDGKRIYLGEYRDIEKAIAVRKDAETLYGFHENHGL